MIDRLSNNARNSVALIIERTISSSVALLFSVWIARVVSPAEFGEIQYATSICALLSIIGTVCLDPIIIRDLLKSDCDNRTVIASGFIIKIIGALTSITAAIIIALNSQQLQYPLLIFILSLTYLFQTTSIIADILQSKNHFYTLIKIRISALAISTAIKSYSLIYLTDPVAIGFLLITDQCILALLLLSFLRNEVVKLEILKYARRKETLTTLKNALPICLSSATVILFIKLDQLMITHFLDAKSTGIYSAMLRLVEPWAVFPSIIMGAYYPSLIRMSVNEAIKASKYYFFYAHISSFVLAIAISLSAPVIVRYTYGEKYSEGSEILSILCFIILFSFSGEVRASIMNAKDLTKYHIHCAILGVISLSILNLLLIPNYGLKGAAIALVTSYFVSAALSTLLIPKLHKLAYAQYWPLSTVKPFDRE